MLKPQDVVLLVKLLATTEHLSWSQNQLALHLCVSVSEVNTAIKRLQKAGLLQHIQGKKIFQPILPAVEEFLISGAKYVFPVQLGEYTRGIPTSYAAPVFKGQIALGQDPPPVWPDAEGTQRGLALKPLYPSVPKSITQYPDAAFYDLLALIDAIRQGRVRERNLAIKLLKERIHYE